MRHPALIVMVLVLVALSILGCESGHERQGVPVDESVIADVLGDCDGTASADELEKVHSHFSQHDTGWFVGVDPLIAQASDNSQVSSDVVLFLFGRYPLCGPYENQSDLRNNNQAVILVVDNVRVGIYVIEKSEGYTITHLYRVMRDRVYDGTWQEIGITSHAMPHKTQEYSWIDDLIERFESEPVANPPLSVWQYTYNGQTVYYVPPMCCDIPSTLYDANGDVICHPDGGITGGGDGRCRDFFEKRTDATLIWQDGRSYP